MGGAFFSPDSGDIPPGPLLNLFGHERNHDEKGLLVVTILGVSRVFALNKSIFADNVQILRNVLMHRLYSRETFVLLL